MKPYQKFADVYDRMGADEHSIKMADYCFRIFRKFKIAPCLGLDLCCGTGSAIRVFCQKGMTMSGLDRSAPMLAVAAKKLKGQNVKLYQKTLPRFNLLETTNSKKIRRFDLVTSFFDSLNYMKNQTELKAAFRSVHRHLKPGGWFIFDMNTPAAMKILWGGQIFATTSADLCTIWKNEYHAATLSATCHTTFFRKKGKYWERFDEIHIERAYANTTVKKLLRDAGFVVKGFYRCFTFDRPTDRTYRICAIAKKPD